MISFLGIVWQLTQWVIIIFGIVYSFRFLITLVNNRDYLADKYGSSDWVAAIVIDLVALIAFVVWFIFKIQ